MAVQMSEAGLDCRKCSPEQKTERGCEKSSPIPGYWKFDSFETDRCPIKLIDPDSLKRVQAYMFYKEGFLPNAGGWMDQPAKLLEAFLIIDAEIRKVQQEKERKGYANQ